MKFRTDYGIFKEDKEIDLGELKSKVKLTRGKRPGKYAIFLGDKRDGIRLAILDKKLYNIGNVVYESYPIHGVTIPRGDRFGGDSLGGLREILEEEFTGFGDCPNVCINEKPNEEWFRDIAKGKERVIWGYPSKDFLTKGDRYFLEFKRSFIIGAKNERPVQIRGLVQCTVSHATKENLRVNVILGSKDFKEISKRTKMYTELFREKCVDHRFFSKLNLINLLEEP